MLVCGCSPALGSRKLQRALIGLSKVHQKGTSAPPAQISHAMLTCSHTLNQRGTNGEQGCWGIF